MTSLALVLAAALVVLPGRVHDFDVPSRTLGGTRDVMVYLPPSYSRPEAARRRYPVVYLLHGWPGSASNWFGRGHADRSADTLIAQGKVPQLILVCPNGNCGLLGRTVYMNSFDAKCHMEDYVVHDLVSWVDSTFRTVTTPAARGVLGLSDGGTGAINFAFRHPDVFSACASHSADLVVPAGSFGLGHVVGHEPEASKRVAEYSPQFEAASRVEQLRTQVIYFDCGSSDESIEENRAFHRTLDSLSVPHVYREFPGSHTWSYWREHFRQALETVTSRMPR